MAETSIRDSISDDEGPETVSLSTSKQNVLDMIKSERSVTVKNSKEERERRREKDTLYKSQAESRKERIAQALAELKKNTTRDTAGRSLGKRPLSSKQISINSEAESEDEEEEEVEVDDGAKVVILKDKRVTSVNIKVAKELAGRKEGMLMSRNRKTRVPASVAMSSKTNGKPASIFRLTPEQRVKAMQKFKPRVIGKPNNRNRKQTKVE